MSNANASDIRGCKVRSSVQNISGPTAEDLLREWGDWLLGERSLARETAKLYKWRLGYLLRLSGKSPLEITTADLREHLVGVCRAANTKSVARNVFRSFFGFLVQEGYREDNPATPLKRPKIPNSMPKYLDSADAKALDEAASWEGLQEHALCRLFLYQGLRVSEACRLTWRPPTRLEDPEDAATGLVSTDQGWLLVRGKGGKDRELPLHPRVKEVLARLYKYRKSDVWLFPRRANKSRPGNEKLPITRECAQVAVKRWAKAAGLDVARVSVHKLRHTFATTYLANGADITYVQAALGHANVAMTMRYARVRKEDLKRTIGKVKY